MNLHIEITPLFLFSITMYVITLLSLIPSDQLHGSIPNIVNFIAVHNIMYICAIIAIIVSLIQNTQHVFDLTGKLDWYRILGRFGMEIIIMLFGTLASLLAFLALFSTRSDIVITVIIFATICIALNLARSNIVNFYDNKFNAKTR